MTNTERLVASQNARMEIEAIAACVSALEPLVDSSQDRILDYLCARYGQRIKVAE